MRIHTIDPVWTECSQETADFIRHALTYDIVRYEMEFGRPKRISEKKCMLQGWNYGQYMFYTGLVPRVLAYLKRHKKQARYTCDIQAVDFKDPHIDGIKFRDYQHDLIMDALEAGYGVIKSPTGSGKSMIIFGIMSAFPNSNILLLAHTLDITQQLIIDLEKFGFNPVSYKAGVEMGRVTVSTVQSYYKVARRNINRFQVVIVDEGHHVSHPTSGMYFETLSHCNAPIRIAVTATEGDHPEQRMSLEGLIGPIIGELTMREGTQLGFLAEPEITFIKSPLPEALFLQNFDGDKKVTGYVHDYKDAIVNNFNRNIRIVLEAEKEVKAGGSVLILVKQIKHIERLLEEIEIPLTVVKGSVKKEDRLAAKEGLKSGKLKCVAATTAWVEGVDIPNLTMVINAGGGLSERETLQKIGRGLRKTENKNTVRIIDFFDVLDINADPLKRNKKGTGKKHVFHKHSIDRWETYKEQGWEPKIQVVRN